MVRSDIRLISTLSGSNFHQKIIKKYQTDKWNTFRFPMMIFCKNAGHFFPKKINTKILLSLYLNNQNIVPSLIVKSLPATKGMFSWLNAEKIILHPLGKRKNISSINKNTEVSFLKYLFRIENLTTELNRILNPLLLTSNAAFYRQAFHTIFTDSKNVNLQSLTANAAFYRQAFHTIFIGSKNVNSQSLTTNTAFYQHAFHAIFADSKNVNSQSLTSNAAFYRQVFHTIFTDSKNVNLQSLTSNAAFYRQAFHTIFTDSKNVNLQSLTSNAVLYRQAFHTIFTDIKNLNPQLLNYKNSTQILNSQKFRTRVNYRSNPNGNHTPIDYENTREYQSAVKYKLHSILSQENLLFNKNTTILKLFSNSTKFIVNGLFFKGLNRETVKKPLINNYYYSFGNGASSSFQKEYAPITSSENLFFQDQGHMEQEIENIKKIVIETKESVLEKSKPSLGEAEIKQCLDINRISDLVYRNIERTIRMERERRGI